jgi:TatA/E family protein of Tat protein translocase
MMNRMSFSETIFLFFLALIIFGPKKLPEIARKVGKAMNEFRRASNEFKAQIEQEIAHLDVEKPTILPPSSSMQGTTSRSWNTVPGDVTPAEAPVAELPSAELGSAEPSATLAATTDQPMPEAGNGAAEPPPVATEAAHPSEVVTPQSSQESHA